MPPETLRTLAADLIAELRHLDRRIAKAASDIQTARSIDSAAASFATYTGTATIDLSSGDVVRQGLSCAGDPPIQSLSMSWPLPRCGKTPRAGPITYASEAKAKVITKKRCDASNDDYPTSSTDNSATTHTGWGQAREDTRGRLYRPARPAQTPHTDASDKSLPGPTTSHTTTDGHPLLTQRGAVYVKLVDVLFRACEGPWGGDVAMKRSSSVPRTSSRRCATSSRRFAIWPIRGCSRHAGCGPARHRILMMPSPRRLRDPRLNRSPVSFVLTRYQSGSRE